MLPLTYMMEHLLHLLCEANFIFGSPCTSYISEKIFLRARHANTHANMWSLFLGEKRGSHLSPDLHFLSCPALTCSYPRQTIWINPPYNYKYDPKKRAEA